MTLPLILDCLKIEIGVANIVCLGLGKCLVSWNVKCESILLQLKSLDNGYGRMNKLYGLSSMYQSFGTLRLLRSDELCGKACNGAFYFSNF